MLYQGTKLANVLLVVCVLSPAAAWAQVAPLGAPAQGTDRTERAPLHFALDESAALLLTTQPTTPPPPPPPPERGRRRPSMVGYIEDPTIGSRIRLRFDTARGNEVPDRAEFFYAKCGCYRDPALQGDAAFDPDAPGPGPGAADNIDFQQIFVQGEFATSDRVSVFAELPIRWIRPQSFIAGTGGPVADAGGLGDVRAGVKIALASMDDQVITLQVRGFLPTGKAEDGLGTDHASIEPALLMYHRAGPRASIESQVGLWYPLSGANGVPTSSDEKFSGSVLFYGVGPAVEVYRGPRVSVAPVVELIGWRVLDGFQTAAPPLTPDASGTNIVHLKIGARVAWDEGGAIYGGWGRALTDQHWYRDIIRLEYRRTF